MYMTAELDIKKLKKNENPENYIMCSNLVAGDNQNQIIWFYEYATCSENLEPLK